MVNLNRLPMPILESYEWQYQGACCDLDPDLFFSPEAERGLRRERREQQAKQVCAGCPVIEQCRQHALSAREPYGVWGGLSESERELIHFPYRAA